MKYVEILLVSLLRFCLVLDVTGAEAMIGRETGTLEHTFLKQKSLRQRLKLQ